MKKQTQKIIAREITQNFRMLLYALFLSFLVGAIIFVLYYPPTNGPIPQEVIQEYREFKSPPAEYNWDGTLKIQPRRYFSMGKVYKNKSHYDNKIPIDDAVLGNAIDYFRWKYHWRNVRENALLALIILLPGLILGRYLVHLVKWVNNNHQKQ